jgi:gliding motility-associated protein GldM
MGGGKLPPRQKMIGMMYLVLTALLAMNISKDVLNAFVTINTSLEKTNATFTQKNEITYNAFAKALADNKDKVKPYYDRAMKAKELSDEVFNYIEKLKILVMRETDAAAKEVGEDTLNLTHVQVKDAYDKSTFILIGSDPANPRNDENSALELKGKIEKLREDLLGLIDEKNRANMNIGLVLNGGRENGVDVSWEVMSFDHVPLAAVVTVLSKIQTDIRNAEADIIKTLYNEVDAGDFKFDVVNAKVIPKSNYVFLGEEFKADVFVAAYSSTQNPDVLVGDLDTNTFKFRGEPRTVGVENGVGKLIEKASSEGVKKYSGLINVKGPDGSIKSYPYSGEYMVAKPTAVVSPSKMNVFYQGVDNPVEISAGGVAPEDLSPSITAGSLTPVAGQKGKYIVRVPAGTQKVNINVAAKQGKDTKQMGSSEFRCKRVPDPIAKFAGKTGSASIGKGELTTAAGLIADMGEGFDFDLKFQVLSFDVVATIGGFEQTKPSNNNLITEDQKNLFKSIKPGGKVYIENIRVKGEDGTNRTLSPINLKVM